MSYSGLFVTIEGGEGVGKSTFLKELASLLIAKGYDVQLTREPGGTPSAQRIREIFLSHDSQDPLTARTELFLVTAARAQHVERLIQPALQSGHIVICDRFSDSTLVYQGFLGGMDRSVIKVLNDISTGGLTPQMTFLLDCPIEIAEARMMQRAAFQGESKSRFDEKDREFHDKVKRAYLQLARENPERYVVLNAGESPQSMAAAAVHSIETVFPNIKNKKFPSGGASHG